MSLTSNVDSFDVRLQNQNAQTHDFRLTTQDSNYGKFSISQKSIAQIQADAAAGLSDHLGDVGSGTEGTATLRRSLGVFDLTLMGIAAIIEREFLQWSVRHRITAARL